MWLIVFTIVVTGIAVIISSGGGGGGGGGSGVAQCQCNRICPGQEFWKDINGCCREGTMGALEVCR